MEIRSLYPTLCVRDVAASRDFYTAVLGLDVVFDSDWYVQLHAPGLPVAQLGLVAVDHPSVPAELQRVAAGVAVSIEVDDVDAAHERARQAGARVVQPLRDEPFGQRHFIAVDPDGAMVDVITLIPMAAEFAASLVR